VGAYLRTRGFVTEQQINAALMAQDAEVRAGRARRIGELLIAQGSITRQQLEIALHDQEQDFFSLFSD
jgi:hypothetical protein